MPASVIKQLEEEIRIIEFELKNELPKELRKATAMGDLRENAEYQSAKQRQEILQARLAQLKKRLSELSLINLDKIPQDRVGFGSKVKLLDGERNVEVVYTLVTSEESNVAEGKISTTSPIGKGLLGKRVGDIVAIRTPAGVKEFEVLELTTIHQLNNA